MPGSNTGTHCDHCSSPVYNQKDMGGYISRLCERHYYKVLEMEAEQNGDWE